LREQFAFPGFWCSSGAKRVDTVDTVDIMEVFRIEAALRFNCMDTIEAVLCPGGLNTASIGCRFDPCLSRQPKNGVSDNEEDRQADLLQNRCGASIKSSKPQSFLWGFLGIFVGLMKRLIPGGQHSGSFL
jgi:hypothetical protein